MKLSCETFFVIPTLFFPLVYSRHRSGHLLRERKIEYKNYLHFCTIPKILQILGNQSSDIIQNNFYFMKFEYFYNEFIYIFKGAVHSTGY